MSKPLIFNTFKYVGMNSYDVIRIFKKNLPKGFGKIGHFGTLDPFACGVLLIAIGGATRLNEYIHSDLSKTYLAIGKLGIATETGDNTGDQCLVDDSAYLKEKIAHFDASFIEKVLQEKFLGRYLQAPHKYSAAKFQGRALHQWTREGVAIEKEKVERIIHQLKVVRYQYPYLSLRVEVSSGTYVRTLFSDCANFLGTHGHLIGLVREAIGHLTVDDSLTRLQWPNHCGELSGLSLDQALPLGKIQLKGQAAIDYRNGMGWVADRKLDDKKYWVYDEKEQLLGLGQLESGKLRTLFNLAH